MKRVLLVGADVHGQNIRVRYGVGQEDPTGRSFCGKKKTDDRDALRLHEALKNHVLAGSSLPAVWVPDEETRDAREVVRCRADWGQKITAVKCEIQALLKRHGLEKPEEYESNWTQAHRVWIKSWLKGKTPLGEGTRQVLGSLFRQLEFLEEEAQVLDQAVRRNPKKKMIGVVACMRKLGVKMWHVALAAAKASA